MGLNVCTFLRSSACLKVMEMLGTSDGNTGLLCTLVVGFFSAYSEKFRTVCLQVLSLVFCSCKMSNSKNAATIWDRLMIN